MSNPVAVGDALRDYVIQLLQAQGYLVQREIRINTKKVDALLVMEDDLSRRRIAIEAKNLSHSLSQRELALIYVEYGSLIQSRDIDEIWVMPSLKFSRENIFEYVFLRATRIAAELGSDGTPTALIDFGREFTDIAETRKPKIVVSNRIELPEPGRYLHAMRFDDLGVSLYR